MPLRRLLQWHQETKSKYVGGCRRQVRALASFLASGAQIVMTVTDCPRFNQSATVV